MATTLTQNITQDDHHWHEGEDRTIRHDVVDASEVPVDMGGWTLRWELFDRVTDAAKFAKLTGGSGITIGNGGGTNDRATVAVDAADTAGFTAGTYRYEFSRTDTGNKVVLAKGYVQIAVGRL